MLYRTTDSFLNAERYVVHRANGAEVASLAPHHYLARTEVCPGVLVSTVKLDFDHQVGDGPPELFETMVLVDLEAPVKIFRREATRSTDEERYLCSTETQAVTVHERLVQDLIPEYDDAADGDRSSGRSQDGDPYDRADLTRG